MECALAFVASATNLGLETRKLPNAPASEFTTTTTTTTGNVNTYARNDVATRTVGYTSVRGSQQYTSYVPTKMRIHFLQNVSHSAAHYRRNEKGMLRGGNSDKEKRTPGEERKEAREEKGTLAEGDGGSRRGKGPRREEGHGPRDGGRGEPEHFVKQGKMRLRRGTTAAFLSLQNYVFRGPPPYLSKHNKFPLCLPFLLLFLLLLLVIPPLPVSSSFASFSPDLQPGRVCPSSMPGPYILLYPSCSILSPHPHFVRFAAS